MAYFGHSSLDFMSSTKVPDHLDDNENDNGSLDEDFVSKGSPLRNPAYIIEMVLNSVLQDLQQRLAFRAQQFLQAEVRDWAVDEWSLEAWIKARGMDIKLKYPSFFVV